MVRKRASAYFLALVVVLAAGLLTATISGAAGDEPLAPMPEKLDAVLGGMIAEPGAKPQTIPGGADYQPESLQPDHVAVPLHTDPEGRSSIDVLMKTGGPLDDLDALGVVVQGVVGDVVAARVPLDSLAQLTSLSNVEFIEAARQLTPTNDVGVAETGAPTFRNTAGVDGSGVVIGVIDTGVDSLVTRPV